MVVIPGGRDHAGWPGYSKAEVAARPAWADDQCGEHPSDRRRCRCGGWWTTRTGRQGVSCTKWGSSLAAARRRDLAAEAGRLF